jgi:excisionase family DNA binding protein
MEKKHFTLEERLEHGAFTVEEAAELKASSRSAVYADIYEGRLPAERHGRARRILGKVLKNYVPGVGVVEKESAR